MSRDAICDLCHHYADAVVRRDGELWASTWDADAVWELGRGRRVEGREAIYELWQKAMGGFNAVVQNVVNQTAALDDAAGTGTGRCYIIESFERADGTKGMLLAYYDDAYVCRDGEWLFASRELVPQYQGPPDLSAPFLNSVAPADDSDS